MFLELDDWMKVPVKQIRLH